MPGGVGGGAQGGLEGGAGLSPEDYEATQRLEADLRANTERLFPPGARCVCAAVSAGSGSLVWASFRFRFYMGS